MNSLNRDIKPGEVVVLSADYIGFPTASARAFVCVSDDGCYRDMPKDRIYGYWQDGTGVDFVKGMGIDPAATSSYKENKDERESSSASRAVRIPGR